MKNLRSDVAYRRVLKLAYVPHVYVNLEDDGDMVFDICDNAGTCVAEVSIKDIISKRKSLTGVTKRLKDALRTPKKKGIEKRLRASLRAGKKVKGGKR